MRRAIVSLGAAAVLAVAATAPAFAAPPLRFEEPFTIAFPDTNLGLVVMVNIDRASYCTPEIVAWEEAVIAWINGGAIGDPPPEPVFPDGFVPIPIQQQETGQGAVVEHARASGLAIEVWELDADALFVGPCSDTDDAMHLVGAGTASWWNNDNDIFGSGTRGNAFGGGGTANLQDGDGNHLRYSWRFHVNSRCHAPLDGPPSCAIERSKLQSR
jgi:hypothetical protein